MGAFLIAQLVKNLPAMWESWVQSLGWLGRSPGEGNGYPLQYSGLENSMDSIVHGVAKSQTQLNDSHFTSERALGVPAALGILPSVVEKSDLHLVP